MTKKPTNHGKLITTKAISELKNHAKRNTPTGLIALKLGRTKSSIRKIASENNISLKPTNQSPYNRLKNNEIQS